MSTWRWARWITVIISMLLVVSGCGKNIPEIDPALAQSKLSVLVMTKPNLQETTKSAIQKTLLAWRNTQHIAFEWMPDVASISEDQTNKLKSVTYDYIIVVGNELNRQVLPVASAIADKKWFLLDDAISYDTPAVSAPNISWRQSGPALMENQWAEWVKQQQVIGKTIEWVTVSTNPIPSLWAPSEEAERISLSDAEGWYPQFQNQVKQHGPSWIVVYSPLENSTLQRMKNLQVPIMNMASTTTELKWDAVFAGLLNQMQNKQWNAGLNGYDPQEFQVNKPQ
ncbi:hypothetical protein ACFQ88_12575 [Paenibacillus sp. NPDC056579]|uniref:hypothetical protein n=1 Tax=Paenibacillus sp. NPDC056579 TaxID=3345871 RepID=UPI003697B250